jgi:murein DD-endopeptidase MepM/ murein hydrolase activator NlpD
VELAIRAPRVAAALALLTAAVAAGIAGAAAPAAKEPRVEKLRCVAGCGGIRRAAAGSRIRWTGHHLAAIDEIRFPGVHGRVSAPAAAASRHSVKAVVPAGASSGRPALLGPGGAHVHGARRLVIVKPGELPGSRAFRLLRSGASPGRFFFDGGRVRLAYRFRARARSDAKLKVVRLSNGAVVRNLIQHHITPYSRHVAAWNGMRANGSAAATGAYGLRVGPPGSRGSEGARFSLFEAEFPVRGSHSYGGSIQRFGAPRTGGRVHQGQDVFSACGTREVAARGGRVQANGSDPQLYGNWLVIDGRATGTDFRYAHLEAPTPLAIGARVRTGQTVGHVGRTGNARTVGCMLHFEEWPSGWLHGHPVDPLPDLYRWDGWS